MKFSELWLREWVNTSSDVEDLSNQITMAGLKVDNIEPVSGIFNGIVIGEIIECNNHPNINGLFITKVDVGTGKLQNIVCSALNCQQGLKVAVAIAGNAILHKDRKIEIMKLHGELSDGILCSFSDLGIFDYYHSGIIELPTDAPIGHDIREYLKLDDNIIDISITPNRADCFSIIGIAREVAIFNHTELHELNITPVLTNISDVLPISVEDVNACPRYLGRVIKDIDIKISTPLWMKEKLRRCNIKSNNIIIDIINYILLELGQPMHAFDKDHINGGIIVRMARNGEVLKLLNDNEINLDSDTLVIADDDHILAIEGIFNGKYASINNKTQDIFLGCAFFNPLIIAGRARRYGLYTNFSHLYECGVNPTLQYKALEYATNLVLDICGGNVGSIIDVTNKKMLPKVTVITLRRNKLDNLIGYHIVDNKVSEILCLIGCKVRRYKRLWRVVPPNWRFDIKIEEDLIEEIARIYGYNNIPSKPTQANLEAITYCKSNSSLEYIKNILSNKGYQEVVTYSFVDPKLQQLVHPDKEPLVLLNPISREMSVMRLSLWSGLLKTIIYNQHRQQNRVRIFEIGFCFTPDNMAYLDVRQDLILAGAIYGKRYEEHWALTKDMVDFYDMKGDLESIFDLTGNLSEIKFSAQKISALHLGQSAAIYLKDEYIGSVGVVHPNIEYKLGLNSRTVIFELKCNKITNFIIPHIEEISRFPINRRDISIIVAENIPVADILIECKKVDANRVVKANLFDVYYGDEIAKGYKSLTISLIIQDIKRTLHEKEISFIVSKCRKALEKRFQALLRN